MILLFREGPLGGRMGGKEEEKKYGGLFGKFEKRLDEFKEEFYQVLTELKKEFKEQQEKLDEKFTEIIKQMKEGNEKADTIIGLLKKIAEK